MNQMPIPVRLLNGFGGAVAHLGLQPVKLTAEGLLETAQKNTGLHDFGGDEFRRPFQLLLAGLEREAQLTTLGRMVARADILRVLENRLGMVELFKQHPEILEQPLERPLFVVGPPRTGTTIFHDLLALDANNRVPLTWETSYPLPPPEAATFQTDARIAKVEADLARVDQLIPDFKKMHPMGAQRAQECVSITSHDFQSMVFDTQFRLPTYQEEVLASDMRTALQWHRRFLQLLQWKTPAQRWVLKTPQHLWHLDYLLREYPDARIVQTHRDPVRVLISLSSLVATLRSLASDQVELAEIARTYARWLAQGYERTIAFRQSGRLPSAQVVDLYFRDFIGDQLGTVRRAYEHFDMELSDDAAAGMQKFLDDNPADKHGKHLYSFQDIGISEQELRDLFRPYQEYFNIPSEPLDQ